MASLKKMNTLYKRDYIKTVTAEDNYVSDYIENKGKEIATNHDSVNQGINALEYQQAQWDSAVHNIDSRCKMKKNSL